MPRVRYELALKAFKRIDTYECGEIFLQDLFSAYDSSRHPDVITGKISPEDANTDFQETFAMHHNTVHDYSPETAVTVDEFIEFYAQMSTMIDSDHVFDQMLTGTWHLDNMNNYYAGTSQLINKVNAHEKWKLDHHRKMFTGNEHDIISPNSNGDWNTVNRTRYQDPVDYGQMPAGNPTWAAGSNPIWGGSRVDEGSRLTKNQLDFY